MKTFSVEEKLHEAPMPGYPGLTIGYVSEVLNGMRKARTLPPEKKRELVAEFRALFAGECRGDEAADLFERAIMQEEGGAS